MPVKKKTSGKKKASGKKKKSGKKASKKKSSTEPQPPWVPGPDDPHSTSCRCRKCQLGELYGEIDVILISPSNGGAKCPIEEVSLPGVELAKLPRRGPSFTLEIHLTPYYTVNELRAEVAKRVYNIPGDIELFRTERAALKGELLDLTKPLRDVVDSGPKDSAPRSKIYVITRGRRFGYASSGQQAYLSTGASLVQERERTLVYSEHKVDKAHHAAERTSRVMLGLPDKDAPRVLPSTLSATVVSKRLHPSRHHHQHHQHHQHQHQRHNHEHEHDTAKKPHSTH